MFVIEKIDVSDSASVLLSAAKSLNALDRFLVEILVSSPKPIRRKQIALAISKTDLCPQTKRAAPTEPYIKHLLSYLARRMKCALKNAGNDELAVLWLDTYSRFYVNEFSRS